MAAYENGYWSSEDGLRLHYRDYPGGADGRPALLCIPGLTRNARDFEGLAERLSPDWRVIAVDLRGRGESAYAKDPMTYLPPVYAQDLQLLLDELALSGFVAVGTSLGGLVTMLLAATRRDLKGAVLNDVGPAIEAKGLERIRSYVGRGGNWPTWMHAARSLADNNRSVYPDYGIEDWLKMAKRLYRIGPSGRITLDYDTRIAEPMRAAEGAEAPDLWPLLDGLKPVPALIVRGALSDVLGIETLERMLATLPKAEAVTVPDVGHAPTLDEPEAAEALDRLLGRVLKES